MFQYYSICLNTGCTKVPYSKSGIQIVIVPVWGQVVGDAPTHQARSIFAEAPSPKKDKLQS